MTTKKRLAFAAAAVAFLCLLAAPFIRFGKGEHVLKRSDAESASAISEIADTKIDSNVDPNMLGAATTGGSSQRNEPPAGPSGGPSGDPQSPGAPNAADDAHAQPVVGAATAQLTPQDFGFFPDTEIGRGIKAALIAANGTGPNAEKEYQKALEVMRANPKEYLAMLSEGYDKLDEIDYLPRLEVTAMMGELDSHEATTKLAEIAVAPMPAAIPDPTLHGATPTMQEGLVRFTAIDGLQALARRGNTEADAALVDLMRGDEAVLQKRAVLAYIESSPNREQRQREAAAILAPEDRWMVHRATVAATQMPVQAPPEGWLEEQRAAKGLPPPTGEPRAVPQSLKDQKPADENDDNGSGTPDEG